MLRATAFTFGCNIGPPAAREYAVEPTGELIIKPSPDKLKMVSLSTSTDRLKILEISFLFTTISFKK